MSGTANPHGWWRALMRILGCPVCESCDCAVPTGAAAYGAGWSCGDDGWVCGACCEQTIRTLDAGVEA